MLKKLFVHLQRVCSLMAVVALFFGSLPAAASIATPASDTLARLKVGLAADHQIVFKTFTGIDASTDTIVLSMPDFVFGSVGVGDIDLFWGPATGFENATSVASVPAAGVWGASIAGTTITFTAPTDSATVTIPGTSFIGIRIGTNVSGGVNQLTNPASPVIAQTSLSGAFGDTNVIGIPIVSDDSVSVTATVPGPVVIGGGGGGGPGPDVTPPIITNVQAINVTTTAATIMWDTNEISNSGVDYGFTISYSSGTVADGAYVTGHSLGLAGLSPNTTYHFRVKSTDTSGNLATTGDFVFTTVPVGAPPADVTPPVISNVQVTNIMDTSALVTWNTDEPSSSLVTYGTTTSYGLSASSGGLVTSHAVQLISLTPGTSYHFFVTSADAANNSSNSVDGQFVTLSDVTPPANVSGLTATPGDAIVTLSWTNPTDPDFAGTKILRKTGGYPTGPFDGVVVYNGSGASTVDTGLTNGITYFYGAYTFDADGNFASGSLASATPIGPVPPPMPEDTEAACSNGVDDDADGQIDCFDPDCAATTVCKPPVTPTPENTSALCSNGADDDKDGLTDCADSECTAFAACKPVPPPSPTSTLPLPPPVVSPTTTVPGLPGGVVAHFFGNGGAVELSPDGSGRVGILAGSNILVIVSVAGLGGIPVSITLSVASPSPSLYALTPSADGTSYSAGFVAPEPGEHVATVTVTFQDGSSKQTSYTLNSQGGGRVVEETLTGPSDQGVSGAVVQLFREVGGAWTPFGTQTTGPDGSYAFVVPNGRYYAEVEKEGFRKTITVPVSVTQNVFNQTISLIGALELIPVPAGAPLAEQAGVVAQNLVKQVSYGVQVAREFVQSPEVQAANAVAAPTLLAMTLVNSASTISMFNLLAYAQYLFTQPLLLLGRRRRKKWGVVFNSLTKQPIDLAIVRLVHFESKLLMQSRVTDKFGRFAFVVKKGNYSLEVVKPGYLFPTQYLKAKKEDVDYLDLYHGDKIEFLQDGVLTVNVALDPVASVETPRRVLWRKTLQSLRHGLAFSAIPLGMVMLVVTPSIPTALLLLAQIGVYLLFRRIAMPAAAKSWGITFDAKTRKPVGRVIVRIFDKKFNKLLETQVTDSNGKYGFFVRRNVYYMTAEKQGYKKFTSPDIDLSAKDEALVDQNIPLEGE